MVLKDINKSISLFSLNLSVQTDPNANKAFTLCDTHNALILSIFSVTILCISMFCTNIHYLNLNIPDATSIFISVRFFSVLFTIAEEYFFTSLDSSNRNQANAVIVIECDHWIWVGSGFYEAFCIVGIYGETNPASDLRPQFFRNPLFIIYCSSSSPDISPTAIPVLLQRWLSIPDRFC